MVYRAACHADCTLLDINMYYVRIQALHIDIFADDKMYCTILLVFIHCVPIKWIQHLNPFNYNITEEQHVNFYYTSYLLLVVVVISYYFNYLGFNIYTASFLRYESLKVELQTHTWILIDDRTSCQWHKLGCRDFCCREPIVSKPWRFCWISITASCTNND